MGELSRFCAFLRAPVPSGEPPLLLSCLARWTRKPALSINQATPTCYIKDPPRQAGMDRMARQPGETLLSYFPAAAAAAHMYTSKEDSVGARGDRPESRVLAAHVPFVQAGSDSMAAFKSPSALQYLFTPRFNVCHVHVRQVRQRRNRRPDLRAAGGAMVYSTAPSDRGGLVRIPCARPEICMHSFSGRLASVFVQNSQS
jgi:hypothetical protein